MSGRDELVFVPLGGSGEIGMNMNLYGFGPPEARQWIMVDCGVTFGDLTTPGVEIIMPDPGFIEELRDDLLAIILTHAHEDHMGAVAHLWPRLRAPIYATPFTAWLMRDRLAEANLLKAAPVTEIALDGALTLGPFDLQFITLTHSIPEPNAIAITTPLGVVLHTGDWKIDPAPMIGETTDIAALRALGDAGVLAVVCDSTNVFTAGRAGSEGDVRAEMIEQIKLASGKVAVACFASNVARMETAILAAEAADRRVCLIGRSMLRMASAAKAVGLLSDVAEFLSEDEAGFMPNEKVLYLCTGSQGEPRAALARIASGQHRNVTLNEGDTVIFSSRVIPGNEKAIFALQNMLADRGVKIVTEKSAPIHVSGHPCRDELEDMYQWARPRMAIPVHGERRHLLEHAELARTLQIPEVVAPRNGDVIRLAPGNLTVIDEAPAGRLHLDGGVLVPAEGEALRDRRRMASNGHLTAVVALNDRGDIVDGPELVSRGLSDGPGGALDDLLEEVAIAMETALEAMGKKARRDDEAIERELVRSARRKIENGQAGRRTLIDIVVMRV